MKEQIEKNEQIKELQEENAELINKTDNDKYSKFLLRQINLQTRQIEYLEIKNKKLEKQIEKMKCCKNCKYDYNEEDVVFSPKACINCINLSYWELKE